MRHLVMGPILEISIFAPEHPVRNCILNVDIGQFTREFALYDATKMSKISVGSGNYVNSSHATISGFMVISAIHITRSMDCVLLWQNHDVVSNRSGRQYIYRSAGIL